MTAQQKREVRDEIITLVLAGHETTALLLTWGFTLSPNVAFMSLRDF